MISLGVKFWADIKPLLTEIRKAEKHLNDFAKQAEKFSRNAERMGKTLTTGLTLPVAAFGAIAVKNFADAEKASASLTAQVKANGKDVASTMRSYSAFAQEMQNLTTYEDDAVIGFLQLAESMQAPDARKATQDAIGLSKAFGVDMTAAIKMAVQAQNGQYTMLSRMNPAIKAAKTDTEKAAISQKMFADSFKVATEQAKVGLGPLEQLKNQINNLTESYGKIISVAIVPIIEKLKAFATWIDSLSETQKKWIVGISLAVAAIGPLILVVGKVAAVVGASVKLFGSLITTLVKIPALLATSPWIALAAAITAVGLAAWAAGRALANMGNDDGLAAKRQKELENEQKAIQEYVAADKKGRAEILSSLRQQAKSYVDLYNKSKAANDTENMEHYQVQVAKINLLVDQMKEAVKAVPKLDLGGEDAADGVGKAITTLKDKLTQLDNAYSVFGDEIDITGEKLKAIKGTIEELTKQGLNAQSEQIKKLIKAYSDLSRASDQQKPISKMPVAEPQTSKAIVDYVERTKKTIDVIVNDDKAKGKIESINDIKLKPLSVNVETTGTDELTAVHDQISKLSDKIINADVNVSDKELLKLEDELKGLQNKEIEIRTKIANNDLQNLVTSLKTINDKIVNFDLNVDGEDKLQGLIDEFNAIRSKAVALKATIDLSGVPSKIEIPSEVKVPEKVTTKILADTSSVPKEFDIKANVDVPKVEVPYTADLSELPKQVTTKVNIDIDVPEVEVPYSADLSALPDEIDIKTKVDVPEIEVPKVEIPYTADLTKLPKDITSKIKVDTSDVPTEINVPVNVQQPKDIKVNVEQPDDVIVKTTVETSEANKSIDDLQSKLKIKGTLISIGADTDAVNEEIDKLTAHLEEIKPVSAEINADIAIKTVKGLGDALKAVDTKEFTSSLEFAQAKLKPFEDALKSLEEKGFKAQSKVVQELFGWYKKLVVEAGNVAAAQAKIKPSSGTLTPVKTPTSLPLPSSAPESMEYVTEEAKIRVTVTGDSEAVKKLSAIGDVLDNIATDKLGFFFSSMKNALSGVVNLAKQAASGFKDGWQSAFSAVAQTLSGVVDGIFGILSANIDNQMAKEEEYYSREKQRIEDSYMTQEQKTKALEKLDKGYDKKRKELMREQAKDAKIAAIFQAVIQGALAVVTALSAGPISGIILAAIVGALAAAQIAMIAAQPLPALAEGGLATAPTMALVGDNPNARIDPEVISPLSKLKSMMKVSQEVTVYGVLSGNDILISSEKSGLKLARVRGY